MNFIDWLIATSTMVGGVLLLNEFYMISVFVLTVSGVLVSLKTDYNPGWVVLFGSILAMFLFFDVFEFLLEFAEFLEK